MKLFFDNVFIKKDDWNFNGFINALYWIFHLTKNVLKWVFAAYLYLAGNYMLLILLIINPLIRFALIGVGNIHNFRKKFRIPGVAVIIFFISKLSHSNHSLD